MSPSTPTAEGAAEKLAKDVAAAESENGLANRNMFLSLVSDLAEDVVELTMTGDRKLRVLVRELTGEERAKLITLQAEAYQKGSLEFANYERQLLMAGVADPASPEGARKPLLNKGDADEMMKLGSSKVQLLVGAIERLSVMGVAAQTRVEGNSGSTLNGDSTSG